MGSKPHKLAEKKNVNLISESLSMSKLDAWWQSNWPNSIAGRLFTAIDFEALSLSKFDAWWQSIWMNSIAGRIFSSIDKLPIPHFAAQGNFLQVCGFVGVIILFSILGLPPVYR